MSWRCARSSRRACSSRSRSSSCARSAASASAGSGASAGGTASVDGFGASSDGWPPPSRRRMNCAHADVLTRPRANAGTDRRCAMSSNGSRGTSCSTTYHSTPAARPASTIASKRKGPLAGRRVARLRTRRAVLHVEQTHAFGVRPDLRHRIAARRMRPSRRPARSRPRAVARSAGRPRPWSRPAARTRSRGCGTRAGSRGSRPPWRTRRARRRSGARHPRSDDPLPASTARSPVGTPVRPAARRRPSRRRAVARCPRGRRRRAAPSRSEAQRAPGVAISGNPASSTAR